MNIWKRAAAIALAAVLGAGLLSGCAGEESPEGEELTLSVCLGDSPGSLDPIRTTEERDLTVLNHLYENLLKTAVDNTGAEVVVSGLAKTCDVNPNNDGTVTYTFRLRKTEWSDGVRVKAKDFVYAWRRLANPASASPSASLLSAVKGYEEVRSSGDTELLAVEAKSDDTLVVTLDSACEWFLSDVCTSPATVPLREDVVQRLKAAASETNERAEAAGSPERVTWCSDYTALVVNGPYMVESSNSGALTLRRNPHYAAAVTTGPEGLTFRYAASPSDAWALYEAGTVDFIAPLPEEQMALLAENEEWEAVPELKTCTLLFNTSLDAFSNPSIRRAFSLTLDRTALSQAAGVGNRPATALVPYGVPDEDDEDFRTHGGALIECDPEGYADRCAQASGLLDTAGYGTGFRFPTLELLCPNDDAHRAAAAAAAEMWANTLGVTVVPKALTAGELAAALQSGEYTIALYDVQGDTNDAESFLTRWGSQDSRNMARYENSAFDTLLSVVASANNEKARRGCLHDAEVLLIDDCPIAPLYFTGTAWRLREAYTGLSRDPRGFFSFSTVARLQ